MTIYYVICGVFLGFIGVSFVLLELKAYRLKRQDLLDSKAKILKELEVYNEKQAATTTVGDQVAQEMFQRLKKKELDHKINSSTATDPLDLYESG